MRLFLAAALFLVALCAGSAARAQTVRHEFDPANLSARRATVAELSDGGCAVLEACAVLPSNDGGTEQADCIVPASGELRSAALRADCRNVLNSAGLRWLARHRFAADGG